METSDSGNSGHVVVPKAWIGKEAIVYNLSWMKTQQIKIKRRTMLKIFIVIVGTLLAMLILGYIIAMSFLYIAAYPCLKKV
jgi:hypothetical protein